MRGDSSLRVMATAGRRQTNIPKTHMRVPARIWSVSGVKRRAFAVREVQQAITKGEKCAERAAGKHAEKKISGDGPAWPARFGGKWLDYRPPEEDGRGKEAEMFDFVPEIGTQGEFERGGNMPGNESDSGENPADEWMGENFSKELHCRPAEEWTECGANEPLREAVEKGKGGRAKKDERRNDQHKENVLDHVNGEGGFIEC
jgi:hypothetical protein